MDLQAIEARLAAATPGPWKRPEPEIYDSYLSPEECECTNGWDNGDCHITLKESGLEDEDGNEYHRHTETDYHHVIGANGKGVTGNYDWESGGILNESDTEFIAHAPADIEALLAEVKLLRWRAERVKKEHAEKWIPDTPPGGYICRVDGDPVESDPCTTVLILEGRYDDER